MKSRALELLSRFIPAAATREMRRFILSIGLLSFASASVTLFEPVFLHSLGLDLIGILLFYLAMHGLMFFLLPLGVRISTRLGPHHGILLSCPFLIVHYLGLYAAKLDGRFLAVAVIALALHNVLFWMNFHMEMTREGQDGERGREISSLIGVSVLASAAGPLAGGLLIATYGFATLFIVASVLILASNVPLMLLPERRDGPPASYGKILRRFADLSGDRRSVAVSMGGFGEEMLALAIWPVFIFLAIGGYASMGALVTSSILLSTLAIMAIGRLTDTQSKHAILRTGAIFSAGAWILRLSLGSRLAVLGIDAGHRVARNVVNVPLLSMLYKRARGQGGYESIVFFEMWIAAWKILTGLVCIALLMAFPGRFEPLFVVGALLALLYAKYP